MTRESKEFKRRIKKMQKHVEALREISKGPGEDEAIDKIQEGVNDLDGFREASDEPPQAGVAG